MEDAVVLVIILDVVSVNSGFLADLSIGCQPLDAAADEDEDDGGHCGDGGGAGSIVAFGPCAEPCKFSLKSSRVVYLLATWPPLVAVSATHWVCCYLLLDDGSSRLLFDVHNSNHIIKIHHRHIIQECWPHLCQMMPKNRTAVSILSERETMPSQAEGARTRVQWVRPAPLLAAALSWKVLKWGKRATGGPSFLKEWDGPMFLWSRSITTIFVCSLWGRWWSCACGGGAASNNHNPISIVLATAIPHHHEVTPSRTVVVVAAVVATHTKTKRPGPETAGGGAVAPASPCRPAAFADADFASSSSLHGDDNSITHSIIILVICNDSNDNKTINLVNQLFFSTSSSRQEWKPVVVVAAVSATSRGNGYRFNTTTTTRCGCS
jgi:hypothetical protein